MSLSWPLRCSRTGDQRGNDASSARYGDALASSAGEEVAIFSGGCFWGVQAVFQHMKGVTSAVSGYTGGKAEGPELRAGEHGHDRPRRIGARNLRPIAGVVRGLAARLLLGGDGSHGAELPGPGSRDAVSLGAVVHDGRTKEHGERVHRAVGKAKVYTNKIVTEVKPAQDFYNAEGYHQDYATLHLGSMATSPSTMRRRW